MENALLLESAALVCFYAQLEDRVLRDTIYEHEVPEMLDYMRRKIGQS